MGIFSADLLCSVCFCAPSWLATIWRKSCRPLQPRSVLGSIGVVLMSCKANFHVVRSALQCLYQTNKSLRSPLPSFPMRGNSSNETKMAAKLSKEEAEEYFTRINYTGSKEPTVEVLTELHRCCDEQ